MSTKFTFDGTLSESAPNSVGTGSTLTPSSNTPTVTAPTLPTSFSFDDTLSSEEFTPYYTGQLPTDHLVEVKVYVAGAEKTLYFSSKGSTVGSQYYEPRLANAGSVKAMLFADGTTMGHSAMGYGTVSIINTDGALDYLLDAGFSGRSITIKELGGVNSPTVTTLVSFVTEQATFDNQSLNLRIKDPQYLVDVLVQQTLYTGGNVGAVGIEGSLDIKGKPKPVMFGNCKNVTPVCVNTSRLIYQVHFGSITSISAVKDKGVALKFGVNRASSTVLQDNIPAAGTYDTCLAQGMIRLGSSPVGAVTVDAIEGSSAGQRTAAQVAKRVYLYCVIGSIDGSFTALDALNSFEVGIYISEPRKLPEVLDEILSSVGGWWTVNEVKMLSVGRLDAPPVSGVIDLSNVEILSLDRLATEDEGRGVPSYKVNINYDKNFTVQDNASLAGRFQTTGEWEIHSGVLQNGCSVAYGNGWFVAANAGTTGYDLARSTDGITWTGIDFPAPSGATDIAYGAGIFVAIVYGTNFYYISSDAITWTLYNFASVLKCSRIIFRNGIFVIVMFDSASMLAQAIATSTNGVLWTMRNTPPSYNWIDCDYGNGVFFMVSKNYANGAISSDNGVTWNAVTLPASGAWEFVTFGNGLFVISGTSGTCLTSRDGSTWTIRTLPVSAPWRAAAWNGAMFIMVTTGNYDFCLMSPDGITWHQRSLDTIHNLEAITFGNGIFLALSYGSSSQVAIYRTTPNLAEATYLGKEFRTAVATDGAVKLTHLNASEITLNTLLVLEANAISEADRQLTIRKVRRDYVAVKVKKSAIPAIPALSQPMKITYPRYGYSGGKVFIMIGYELISDKNEITFFLWG